MSPDVTERDTQSSAPNGGKVHGATASPVLARRLAASFAWVSLVALAMCVILEGLLGTVETSVAEMQADEAAIHNGLDLAAAVREQYIHQAHVLPISCWSIPSLVAARPGILALRPSRWTRWSATSGQATCASFVA